MSEGETERKFRGSGGPPPPSGGGGGGGGDYEENPFEFRENIGPGQRRIKPFFVAKKATTGCVVLDKGRFDYSVMLHARFFYNGHFGNYAVCRGKLDDKGCPLCEIKKVGDPRWYLVGSIIDRTKYSFDEGRNAGKVYTDLRRLLLIHRGALAEFEDMEVDDDEGVDGDWRGIKCKVKRSDEKKSPRIGSKWRTKGRMTEEEMVEAFESVAESYEIPVEDYIAPVDYEEVLAPYDYDALKELANEIKAAKGYDDSKSSKSSGRKEKAKASTSSDDDVPF
jgi:hypothetical protein